jgi:hypothetical protein
MTKAAQDIHPAVPVRIIRERIRGATWTAIADGLNADKIRTRGKREWTPSACSNTAKILLDDLGEIHCAAVPIEDHDLAIAEITAERDRYKRLCLRATYEQDHARRQGALARLEFERLRSEVV